MAGGYKKGLSKQVSKRKVFTKDVLSRVLQDELREVANKEVDDWFGEQIKEKSKGRNHDLSVAEYKVAQETKYLTQLQKQVEESDRAVKANKAVEKEYTDKKEKLETDISYLENPVFLGFSRYQNDSFHNFKEITKTLANPVFTRVFLMFAFWEKVAEKWSIFDGSTQI